MTQLAAKRTHAIRSAATIIADRYGTDVCLMGSLLHNNGFPWEPTKAVVGVKGNPLQGATKGTTNIDILPLRSRYQPGGGGVVTEVGR